MSHSRAPAAILAVLSLSLAAACLTPYPQRLPGPLVAPHAPGAEPAAEAAEPAAAASATVQRDSDPVWIRRPGERGDVALPFYEKRARLAPGTLVRTGAGGRAEVLWSPDATALILFDEGRLTLGDTERGEPLVRLHSVTRALLTLTPEDRIELPGGARLAGDALEPSGPIELESATGSVVRVTNQSKRMVQITYRDAREELGGGESIDLPILASGSAPEEAAEPQRFTLSSQPVAVYGRADRSDEPGGVRLTALEPVRVRALGIEAQLAPQDWLRFSGLAQVPAVNPADPRRER